MPSRSPPLPLIVSCGWWIDRVNEYPGPMALVPVGATLAIIWAGSVAQEKARPGELPRPMPEVSRAMAGQGPVAGVDRLLAVPVALAVADLLPRLARHGPGQRSRRGRPAGPRRSRWHGPPRGTSRIPCAVDRGAATLRPIGMARLPDDGVVDPRGPDGRVGCGDQGVGRHVSATVVDTRNLDRPCIRVRGRSSTGARSDVDPRPTPLEVLHDYPETSTDGFMSDFTDGEIHVGTYGAPNGRKTIALVGGSHSEM